MKKALLAIELDDNTLKLMQGRTTSKGWSVRKFGVEDISGKSEEDTITTIKDTLSKLKIKKINSILVVPRSLVTVRYLQLPTTNPDELDSMIDMQVVRQIPYTREEMVYDYHITGLTEEGYTKVLLVIAHRDIISKYLRILELVGIMPDSIELDSLAIIELYKFLNRDETRILAEEKPIVILDIDYATTNIVVAQKGVPTFTRAVSIGTTQLSGKTPPPIGKDWISEWVGEINRSLTVIQREQAVSIEKIIILGDYSGGFVPMVMDKLGFPVSSFDPGPYLDGISLSGVNVSITSLLGAIREGSNTSVNLMPEEIRSSRISAQKRRVLVVTGLLIAGIIGIAGLTLDKKIKDRKAYLSSLEKRLSQTNPMAEELSVKKDRLALIKKQLSVSGSSLDILRELYSIIPQKTALNVFIYDDTQGVTIKGASPAMSEVFDLIPKLESSPYFEDVTSRYATRRKIKGQEITEFHIDCSITIPGEG